MTESNQDIQDRLYNLLPAIYRINDAEGRVGNQSLRALLAVIETEMNRLEDDIDGLYADWFIETCAEWVVPYIGDLLGVRNLYSGESTGNIFNQRAYVANTLAYRRRKGTAAVLEQLARDITAWPSHAVEFFKLLVTNQHLNHLRLNTLATVDLRQANDLELLGSPFETSTHTVEVRRIESNRGKYNIPNIGLFLWQLQSYFVLQSTPRKVEDGLYTFSPLGNNTPLFNRPQTETEITQLAQEINVPGLLRRRALYDELKDLREMLVSGSGNPPEDYFGIKPVLQVFFDDVNTEIQPEEIVICDLSGWDESGWQPAASKTFTKPDSTTFETKVAVDPVLGRLAVLNGVTLPKKVIVSYAYGFSGDIGGGPYDRRDTITTAADVDTWDKTVSKTDSSADFKTIADALSSWSAWAAASASNTDAIITIIDNDTYEEELSVTMNSSMDLTIQADNGNRPTLCLLDGSETMADFVIASGDPTADATLTFDGLWIEGGINVEDKSGLKKLNITHCTLVPGRGLTIDNQPRRPHLPSLAVDSQSNSNLQVEIKYSITGPLDLPEEITSLTVEDSVIQSETVSSSKTVKTVPALVSGSLASYSGLTATKPSFQIQIGQEGPYTADLTTKTNTLAQARDSLQKAIRAAHDSPAFKKASVILTKNRLVIIPGVTATVTVTPSSKDVKTCSELRLSGNSELLVQALLSEPVEWSVTLTAAKPELTVTMGSYGPYTIALKSGKVTLASARDQLYKTIREASKETAFSNAFVGNLDNQLVVLPGVADTSAVFGPTDDDLTTYRELGLGYVPLAIGIGEEQPGPKTSLERLTVFGNTYVRELTLASETIFTGRVMAQRRQVGCTRFSFVPDGSRVPRRYYCQPDLALEEYAEAEGLSSVALLSNKERAGVIARVTPVFASELYGDPQYARLHFICPEEITTGAEDASEMGVFCHLKQPQRKANLAAALEEYLRFGLEAGIFDVILEPNKEQGEDNEG